MLRRLSSVSTKIAIASLATSLATSLALLPFAEDASAETAWGRADSRLVTTAVKKKKKNKKRMKASARRGSGRSIASTGSNGRYLAQEDLESDLDADLNSELDADLADDAPASSSNASTEASPVTEPAVSAMAGEDVQILDIQYDTKKDGGTVLISTTGAATYRTREVPSQNQVVVEVANAKLPDRLKRPFNTKDFKQSIVSINAYQEAGSNTARIVLQYRQPRSVDVRQNGKTLSIVTMGAGATPQAPSSAAPAVAQNSKSDDFGDDDSGDSGGDAAAVESLESGTDEAIALSGGGTAAPDPVEMHSPVRNKGSGRILPSSSLEQERVGDFRFYGKPISIEVRDTPVRDVITLISDQSGANIIMSDDVQGAITIKLRQVPWDQALSIIMKTRGLGYVRQNGVLRIAPIRQLQAEAEEARRIIEAQESTLPLRVRVIPVSFASVTLLATQIRNTLQGSSGSGGAAAGGGGASGGRGKIEADPRSSSLIITDTDENIRRIEQLVKALDTAPLQVMIEGKIVEAKEEAGRRLGINWGYQGQDLGFAGGTLSHNAQINPAVGVSNTTLDLKLGTLDFLGDLNAKLSLFESESVAKIISSPRVITMNAQKATIEQAISIPISTSTITPGAPAQVSTTYKTIPTILDVTPQITPGGDVLMQIAFRREYQGATQPGSNELQIESRDVKTNVMVKNGQTTVIGGIYQSDQTEIEQGTPFLRKIPVLGWLFKSKENTSIRNELLVFITPRILNADRTLPKASAVQ